MKVSVVIPTYNGADFLEETLASVFRQSFADIEVVVSDDGSTDGTLRLVEAAAEPRLRIVDDRSHVGPAGNWNRALAAAQGQYVKVLAQDDVLYPEILRVQVEALDHNQKAAFAAVQRDVIGSDGSILLRKRGLASLCGDADKIAASRRIVRSGANQFGEGAAVLFRRKASAAVGWFDGTLPYAIDIDYWMRLLSWGSAVGICSAHAAFRVSSQSWSNSLAREQGRQYAALIDRFAADATRGIRRSDVAIGKARSQVNSALRQAFYWRHRNHI